MDSPELRFETWDLGCATWDERQSGLSPVTRNELCEEGFCDELDCL